MQGQRLTPIVSTHKYIFILMFIMDNQFTYFLKTCTDNYNNGYNIIQIVAAIPS